MPAFAGMTSGHQAPIYAALSSGLSGDFSQLLSQARKPCLLPSAMGGKGDATAVIIQEPERNVPTFIRQQSPHAIRPFDDSHAGAEHYFPPRQRFQLIERGQSVEIKVIKSQASFIFIDDGEGWTGDGNLLRHSHTSRDPAGEERLSGTELPPEGQDVTALNLLADPGAKPQTAAFVH